MSARDGAPALRRAQMTPVSTRMTRRAMAVTAATLSAPLMALAGLAAVGASVGGDQAEMGALAGAQGLRGTTVAASSPAPPPLASAPTVKAPEGRESDVATAAAVGSHETRDRMPQSEPRSAPHTREPAQKTQPPTVPRTPARRINLSPPAPTADPSEPGAPATPDVEDGPGSPGSNGGSSTGSNSGSSSGQGSPDDHSGQSGSD
jgi:hypothetical protein